MANDPKETAKALVYRVRKIQAERMSADIKRITAESNRINSLIKPKGVKFK